MSKKQNYKLPIDPKSLRESINVATGVLHRSGGVGPFVERAIEHLELLGRECDRKRPTGSDGKHGDRHTQECGCDDNPFDRWCCWWCKGSGFNLLGRNDPRGPFLCLKCDGRGWTEGR